MAGDIAVALLGPVLVAADGTLAPVAGAKLQSLVACSPSPRPTRSPTTV